MQFKAKPLAVAAILMLSAFLPRMPVAIEAGTTYLMVVNPATLDEWFNFTTHNKRVGDTFTTNMTVVLVSSLANWQVMFTWNASLLELVNITLPSDHVFAKANRTMITPPPTVASGSVTWSCTYVNDPYWTFNGTGCLCQITLRITQGVFQSGPQQVSCNLSLANVGSDTWLLNGQGNDILFTRVRGYYNYAVQTCLQTINPLTGDEWFNFTSSTMNVGDSFVVNMTVEDVTDLAYWSIHLVWNASMLDFVSILLPSDHVFAKSNRTMLTPPPTVGPGSVMWNCAYINDPYWTFNGTGCLCQVTLRITQGSVREVSSNLTLFALGSDTYLFNGNGNDITFTPVNGHYNFKFAQTFPVQWLPTCPPPYVASATPRINEPVLVKANVTGAILENAILRFRIQNEQWFNVSMVFNETDNLWTQTIPAQSQNCTIEFFIKLFDHFGFSLQSSTYTFYVKPLPIGDLNGDGVVNMRDIGITCNNFGKTAP